MKQTTRATYRKRKRRRLVRRLMRVEGLSREYAAAVIEMCYRRCAPDEYRRAG